MDYCFLSGRNSSADGQGFGQNMRRNCLIAVNQQKIGLRVKPGNSMGHGGKGSLQDIFAVYLRRPDYAKAVCLRASLYLRFEPGAFFCGKGFGIAKTRKVEHLGQNNSRGYNGAGQAAPPGFVNSGTKRPHRLNNGRGA